MSNWKFEIPRINPLRFRMQSYNLIDYDSIMPRFDLMKINEDYQKGEYHIEAYPDFMINKTISNQFSAQLYDLVSTFRARLYKVGTSGYIQQITPTNITPVFYSGYNVFKINFTPTSSGFYYITFTISQISPTDPLSKVEPTFISDTFYVSDSLSTQKNLIELKYKNSENDFGMVFDDYYTAFYECMYSEGDGEIEESTFQVDSGTSKQRSYYYPQIDVVFCNIKKRYKQTLINQLRCDSILFNGMECICKDSITSENIDKTDLVNITTKLTLKSDNNLLDLY